MDYYNTTNNMLNKKDQARLARDWKTMSRKALKDKYDLSGNMIDTYVKKFGLKAKKRKKITLEQKYYILDNPTVSYAKLAEELGISYAMVASILRKKPKK
jgi:hypothetical protein